MAELQTIKAIEGGVYMVTLRNVLQPSRNLASTEAFRVVAADPESLVDLSLVETADVGFSTEILSTGGDFFPTGSLVEVLVGSQWQVVEIVGYDASMEEYIIMYQGEECCVGVNEVREHKEDFAGSERRRKLLEKAKERKKGISRANSGSKMALDSAGGSAVPKLGAKSESEQQLAFIQGILGKVAAANDAEHVAFLDDSDTVVESVSSSVSQVDTVVDYSSDLVDGAFVLASREDSDGAYFPATIIEVDESSDLFVVCFEADNMVQSDTPRELLRPFEVAESGATPAPAQTGAASLWRVGDEVEAVWFEDDIYYLASITAVIGNGEAYDVIFTEYGNAQPNTPASLIRPLTSLEELSRMGLLLPEEKVTDSAAPPDQMPEAEWQQLVKVVVCGLHVRDVALGQEVHHNVFDGFRAVRWLVDQKWKGIDTRADATRIFQRMLTEGIIAPLSHQSSRVFTDAIVLYSLKHSVAERVSGTGPQSLVRRDTLHQLKEYLAEEIDQELQSQCAQSEISTHDPYAGFSMEQEVTSLEVSSLDHSVQFPLEGHVEVGDDEFWAKADQLVKDRAATIGKVSEQERLQQEEAIKTLHIKRQQLVKGVKWIPKKPRKYPVDGGGGGGGGDVDTVVAPVATSPPPKKVLPTVPPIKMRPVETSPPESPAHSPGKGVAANSPPESPTRKWIASPSRSENPLSPRDKPLPSPPPNKGDRSPKPSGGASPPAAATLKALPPAPVRGSGSGKKTPKTMSPATSPRAQDIAAAWTNPYGSLGRNSMTAPDMPAPPVPKSSSAPIEQISGPRMASAKAVASSTQSPSRRGANNTPAASATSTPESPKKVYTGGSPLSSSTDTDMGKDISSPRAAAAVPLRMVKTGPSAPGSPALASRNAGDGPRLPAPRQFGPLAPMDVKQPERQFVDTSVAAPVRPPTREASSRLSNSGPVGSTLPPRSGAPNSNSSSGNLGMSDGIAYSPQVAQRTPVMKRPGSDVYAQGSPVAGKRIPVQDSNDTGSSPPPPRAPLLQEDRKSPMPSRAVSSPLVQRAVVNSMMAAKGSPGPQRATKQETPGTPKVVVRKTDGGDSKPALVPPPPKSKPLTPNAPAPSRPPPPRYGAPPPSAGEASAPSLPLLPASGTDRPLPSAGRGGGLRLQPTSAPFLGACTVKDNFVARRPQQISVVAGTIVAVMERPSPDWLLVCVAGHVGLIPVSIVESFSRVVVDGIPETVAPAGRGGGAVGRGAGRGRGKPGLALSGPGRGRGRPQIHI